MLSFFLLTNESLAGPTSSVSHTHRGRMHSHPLPIQGLGHRHGQGAYGVSTNINRLEYQRYEGKMRRPTQKEGLVIRSIINQSPKQENYFNIIKGGERCKRGNAGCNVSASKVHSQFNEAASRKIKWSTKPSRFSLPNHYAPYGLRSLDLFDGSPAYVLGIPDTHIQGFVRTNSSRFPYAGTHGHKKRGGIFKIKQDRDCKKYLSSLHQSRNKHPSGAQILGRYLLYGDGHSIVF